MWHLNQTRRHGFSLIELVLVVMILAIVASGATLLIGNFTPGSGKTAEETITETSELNHDNSQFLAMAKEISDELIDELTNDEQNPEVEVETILISEYDAGDVEAEQLVDEEASMSNHNEVNVITHDSLDDIVEHLAGAEIIGDLPEEVKF